MNNSGQSEKIEAYLRGELSASERAAFESDLAQDPILQSEYRLQRDVIDALKTFRKNELKQRLGVIEVALVPAYVRYLRVAAISGTVIGSFAWTAWAVYNQQFSAQEASQKIVERLVMPSKEKYQATDNINAKTHVIKTEELAKNIQEQPQEINTTEPLQRNLKTSYPTTQNSNTIATQTQGNPDNLTTKANALEEDMSPNHANELEKVSDNAKTLEKLTYQYYNEKLFLFGNVSRGQLIPMEVNGKTKQFLFYEDKYYLLNENQIEVAEPTQITDSLLIEQLEKRRNFSKSRN